MAPIRPAAVEVVDHEQELIAGLPHLEVRHQGGAHVAADIDVVQLEALLQRQAGLIVDDCLPIATAGDTEDALELRVFARGGGNLEQVCGLRSCWKPRLPVLSN